MIAGKLNLVVCRKRERIKQNKVKSGRWRGKYEHGRFGKESLDKTISINLPLKDVEKHSNTNEFSAESAEWKVRQTVNNKESHCGLTNWFFLSWVLLWYVCLFCVDFSSCDKTEKRIATQQIDEMRVSGRFETWNLYR